MYAADLGIKPRSVFCKTLILSITLDSSVWVVFVSYLFSDTGIGCLLQVDLPQPPKH